MPDSRLPDLTFSTAMYGRKEIPMDLKVLLYRGASSESFHTVFNKIASNEFGKPIQERIEIVREIHEKLNSSLAAGRSQYSIKGIFYNFRSFFGWVDKQNIQLSKTSIKENFQLWADHLFDRMLRKEIKPTSAYSQALVVSRVLMEVLENPKPLIATTRLRFSNQNHAVGTDDQNIGDIFKFGGLLIDIVHCLDIKAIYGTLPVKIELKNGATWNEWSGLKDPDKFKPNSRGNDYIKRVLAKRLARENRHTIKTRFPLINLRLLAELLIFISQTGMNLTQARQLRLSQANYKSSIDGYQVRAYKSRKGGEVSFEIFSEYREYFDKFLIWRKEIFKDTSELLFPFCNTDGSFTPALSNINYSRIKNICKTANVPFATPKMLRKTRINWFYRQTKNPESTSEQAQNTKNVLYKYYLQPSIQVAKVEFIQYWNKNDPTLQQCKVGPAPAPGVCDGIPVTIPGMPSEAPKPDCLHPGGCLFCEHHRDIDSEDYVWAMTSMKHLNAILVAKYPPIKKNKTDLGSHVETILVMLTQKLKWLKSSSKKRGQWVSEASDRCSEGDFHPHWSYLIESVEI